MPTPIDPTPVVDLPPIVCGFPYQQPLLLVGPGHEPMDLGGYTALMTVRDSEGGATVLAVLSTANHHLAIGPRRGQVTVSLSAAETLAIAWTTSHYDLELIDAYGVPWRALKGSLGAVLADTRIGTPVAPPTA